METFFMNSGISKTSDPHRFRLDLTDQLNLKDPKKSMVLTNLSIYYTWKTLNQNNTTIHLKFQHQLGMILLIYQTDLIQFLTFKTTLNLSSKNMKL